jgi:tRNA-2-methylthio-N6-dimethylallyladenosine synthase
MEPRTFFIRTYGCQMNESDSERIAGALIDRGYSMAASPEEAGLVVLNTCSIRDGAENKVYSDLGRLKGLEAERGRAMTVAVAGCVAQQEGERLLSQGRGVDLVFGSRAIVRLPELIQRVEAGERVAETGVHTRPDHAGAHVRQAPPRAWVTVMEGCDKGCAFCVVPATRGPEVSRRMDGVVAEVEALAAEGYTEVTLLGQNVTAYGRGLEEGTDFAALLARLHAIEALRRIRYTTGHPLDFDDRLIETLAKCPKVVRHLHLPLQSGSDRVLEAMGRGHTWAFYRDRIRRVRDAVPGIAVTTDLIVGFPGETEDDFARTLDAVAEIGFLNLYGFKYSRRPGTAALGLPDHLPEAVKAERLERLLALQRPRTRARHEAFVGGVYDVLVEGVSRRNAERLTGRLEEGVPVHFPGPAAWVGAFRRVRITEAHASALIGEAA